MGNGAREGEALLEEQKLARELLGALMTARPATVIQKAHDCIAWRRHQRWQAAGGSAAEERGEVLAAVAASAQARYEAGGGGMLPAEFTLLTHFLV